MSNSTVPYPIYIDLDRTLYQTDLLPIIIEQFKNFSHEIKPELFLKEGIKYHVETEVGYYYDMSAHLTAYNLDPAEMYERVRSSAIADNRLLFPGGEALAEWLQARGNAHILTYGTDDYQRFKAALCPALDGIPVITTLADKAVWFRREAAETPALMIDDKPIGGALPNDVDFIQVQLKGRSQGATGDWPVLKSLDEVLGELKSRDNVSFSSY